MAEIEEQVSEPAEDQPQASGDSPDASRRWLVALVFLGVASTLWAFFLWWQLLRARSGFEPVCIGSGSCADLWDAAFAARIHGWTGMPVAAWGAVWGTVAAFLPLQALGSRDTESPWRAAGVWTGLAGLLGTLVLLGVSAAEGLFCGSCAVTYVLSALYGAIALGKFRAGGFSQRGLVFAVVATLVTWGLYLYPGVRTPKNVFKESQQAFDKAAADSSEMTQAEEPVHTDKSVVSQDNPLRISTWPLSEEEQTRRIKERLEQTPERWDAALALALKKYKEYELKAPLPEPRHLLGSPDSDLRLTIFTDTQCGHCAQLHDTLTVMLQLFPEGTFSIDSRHFPLDGRCNPFIRPNPDRLSCAAAQARLCVEDVPSSWRLETQLYSFQKDLTEAKIFETLAGHKDEATLRACMASPETAEQLKQDVEVAMRYDIHGTPLVVVNGRPWTQDAMMIYLIFVANGNADHPGFAELPPPAAEPEHRH